MHLWLVRHGEAEAYQSNDELRALTVKGRQDIHALAAKLQQWQVQPQRILVSPYLRAQQTLSILQAQNAWSQAAELSEHITPDASMSDCLQLLEGNKSTLMVSHQPLVSLLLAMLIDGHARYAYDYPMNPGSIACVRLDAWQAGAAHLEFLYSPPYD